MRTWIFGIAAFILWSAGSCYWYVCKIKGACETDSRMVQVILPNDRLVQHSKQAPIDRDDFDVKPAKVIKSRPKVQNVLPPAPKAPKESVDLNTKPNSQPDPKPDSKPNAPSRQTGKAHTVLFAFARPIPENKREFDAYIEDLSTDLLANPRKKVLLEGYTDDTAAKQNNLKLALRRCNVIADLLIEKGVPENQILKEALGEANPVATNNTQAGRRLNRRVVISIQE